MADNDQRNSREVERKSVVKLTREERNKLINEIQDFFYEERDEQIGVIAAEAVLDFFLSNLGIFIGNKVLDEAKLWFSKRMDDLEADFEVLYK